MMDNLMNQLAAGALLHDIGQLQCGTGEVPHPQSGANWLSQFFQNEKVIHCVRYHHSDAQGYGTLPNDDPVHLVVLANRLAEGELSCQKGASPKYALSSVFNLLNGLNGTAKLQPAPLSRPPRMPSDKAECGDRARQQALEGIKAGFSVLGGRLDVIKIQELLETYASYIPAGAQEGRPGDISLSEHSRLTAAFACCLLAWCRAQGIRDFKDFAQDPASLQQKIFLLTSLDMSGIQRFIYHVIQKGALKALRARSFYLEVLLENAADEILRICGLPRSNLLYTGGGHAYLLMPHTDAVVHGIREAMTHINDHLRQRYGTELFLAYGMMPCSGVALSSQAGNADEYTAAFRGVASEIAGMKLHRYSAQQLLAMNSWHEEPSGRECAACGAPAVQSAQGEEPICQLCASFQKISSALTDEDNLYVITSKLEEPDDPPVPGAAGDSFGLQAMTVAEMLEKQRAAPDSIVRAYRKNELNTDDVPAIRLWMGDLTARAENGSVLTFSELTAKTTGIERLGILRADVDNLGQTFIQGFVRPEKDGAGHLLSLVRTMTLSRQLSLFFKFYINNVLSTGEYSLPGVARTRELTVIYSGGDDILLAGPWQEVICAGIDLRRAFRRYTGGALTLSAGIGLFDEKFPLSQMAAETGRLEEAAKAYKQPGHHKDAVALFGMEAADDGGGQAMVCRHIYSWEELEQQVLSEKYQLLVDVLGTRPQELGSAFVYALLELLRSSQEDRLNIAQLAYLLARREGARGASQEAVQAYNAFKQRVYAWALHPRDRGQLITALMMYIYTHRMKEE